MARRVDQATGISTMISLYRSYYRPASTFTVHAGAASPLRHVSNDDGISPTPRRTWARRTPVRIADACFGLLTAAVAQRSNIPYQEAIRYADRHGSRAQTPVTAMSASGLSRSIRLGKIMAMRRQVRSLGDYIESGKTLVPQTPGLRKYARA